MHRDVTKMFGQLSERAHATRPTVKNYDRRPGNLVFAGLHARNRKRQLDANIYMCVSIDYLT